MKEFKEIKMRYADDLEIMIQGYSEDFFCQDLYTKAVETLIEEADVDGWAKHHDDMDAYENFSVSVLMSATRAYIRQIDHPSLDNLTYREAFLRMVDDLKNNSRFNEKINLDEIYGAD